MELQAGTSAIDAAVVARDLSSRKTEREAASQILKGPKTNIRGDRDRFLRQLREAFYGAMIITYGQGMDLLRRASQAYAYGLSLEAVARIWRGGCIIRAALLEEIRAAYRTQADLPNLLLDRRLGNYAPWSAQPPARGCRCRSSWLPLRISTPIAVGGFRPI